MEDLDRILSEKSGGRLQRVFDWIKRYKYIAIMFCILSFSCVLVYFTLPPSFSFNFVAEAIFFSITVIILDTLLESQRLQKSQRSMKYVRQKVLDVCTRLIWEMRPPEDWQKRLERRSDWTDFCEKTDKVRNEALNGLEAILDKHGYLLEVELRNDILDLVSSLEDVIWSSFRPKKVSTNDEALISYLLGIAFCTRNIIFQASKIIKQHELITGEFIFSDFRGETRKIKTKIVPDIETRKEYDYSMHEKFLKDAIDFGNQIISLLKDMH